MDSVLALPLCLLDFGGGGGGVSSLQRTLGFRAGVGQGWLSGSVETWPLSGEKLFLGRKHD